MSSLATLGAGLVVCSESVVCSSITIGKLSVLGMSCHTDRVHNYPRIEEEAEGHQSDLVNSVELQGGKRGLRRARPRTSVTKEGTEGSGLSRKEKESSLEYYQAKRKEN